MKLSRFTILLTALSVFSAQTILAGGEEDKILTSCLKKSPASESFRKRVDFEPQFRATVTKPSSPNKFGVIQKDFDKYSAWDKKNKKHGKNITLKFDPKTGDLVGVKEITEDLKTCLAQRKQKYVDDLTVADFEWEFAFSALARVLGLSDQIDARHASWDQYSNDETMMVLRTVAFAFEMVADIGTSAYLIQHQEMMNHLFQSFQESEYYEYRAGYDTWEMLQDAPYPVARSVIDKLTLDRKDILIAMDIHSLQARAVRGKTIISKLIQENIFGCFDKRQSILDELEDCFRDNQNPNSLFDNSEPQQKDQFKRFVIAIKEASFRFLTPSETYFADTFDQTHYGESSEDESEDLSENFMAQEWDDIDSQEIDPERIIERSISRLEH